jgi:hypothetical protein
MFCGLCKNLQNASAVTGRLHEGLTAPCPNPNCGREVFWPNKAVFNKAVLRTGGITAEDMLNQTKKIEARRSGRVDTNFPAIDSISGMKFHSISVID